MSMQCAHPLICDARNLTSSSSEWSRPQLRTNMCRPIMAFSPWGEALRKSRRAFMAASFRAISFSCSVSWLEQRLRLGAGHRMRQHVEAAAVQLFADFLDHRHDREGG